MTILPRILEDRKSISIRKPPESCTLHQAASSVLLSILISVSTKWGKFFDVACLRLAWTWKLADPALTTMPIIVDAASKLGPGREQVLTILQRWVLRLLTLLLRLSRGLLIDGMLLLRSLYRCVLYGALVCICPDSLPRILVLRLRCTRQRGKLSACDRLALSTLEHVIPWWSAFDILLHIS